MNSLSTRQDPVTKHDPRSQCWVRIIGIECLLVGLILNSSAVNRMLGLHGLFLAWPVQTGVIGLQIILFGTGLFLLAGRTRRTRVRLGLGLASAGLGIVVNILFIQFSYRPPIIACGWQFSGSEKERNQLGFRGRPIVYGKDDFVVLLVGDSQVEAPDCAFGQMPERLLEKHLCDLGRPVRVFSLSASGYGQDQEWLMLQEYYHAHRADLVVLWETRSNDIWNNVFPTHWPANGAPKPTFWLEHDKLLGPDRKMGELIDYSPIKVVTLWKRFTKESRLSHLDEDWEGHLPPPYTPLTNYDGPINRAWDRLAGSLMAHENLETEKSHLAVYLTPPSPRMEYGIALTRELLRRIESLVRVKGGRCVFFYRKTPESFVGEEEVCVFKGKYYRASVKQKDATFRRLNEGFNFFEIPVTLKDWRINVGNAHLNERANDQVMGDLARALLDFIPAPAVSNQAVTKR